MDAETRAALETRFEKNVDRSGDHHIWTGGRDKGYGRFFMQGINYRAHRAAWILFRGDPGEMMVLHKCRERSCVNLNHLYLGTAKDNAHDSIRDGTKFAPMRGRTHCKNGHEWNERNTRIRPSGERDCRECHRLKSIRRRRRLAGGAA